MVLRHTLYPRDTATGNLLQEPATIAASAVAPPGKVRFSDVLEAAGRIGDADYIVLEVRIFKFDGSTITNLTATEVTSAGGVRVGVAVTGVGVTYAFQTPGDVGTTLSSPFQLSSDILAQWVSIPAPPPATGSPPDIGDFRVQYDAATGVFRVHIDPHDEWVQGQTSGDFNLELVIENALPTQLRVVFAAIQTSKVRSSPPADDTIKPALFQPWVHVQQTFDFGLVPPALSSRTLQLFNFGTGPATIGGSFPAGAAFTTNASGTLSVGGTLAAGSAGTLGFTFTRPVDKQAGEVNTIFGLSGDPLATPGHTLHNSQLSLTAAFGEVEIMLVLDGSGSMSWDAVGNSPPSIGPSRWERLADAVVAFLGIVRDSTDDADGDGVNAPAKVGVVVFPRISAAPGDWSHELLFPMSQLTDAFISSVMTQLNTLSPHGSTPMGEGLQHAYAQFSATLSNQQSLVLLSDGASNGPLDPTTLKGMLDATLDDTVAIMYGDPASNTTNRTILNNVVDAQDVVEGFRPDAEIPDQLNKAFSKIAADIAGLMGANDPAGQVSRLAPVAVHDFTISEFDKTFTLWLGWDTFDSRRISVELISPRCELIRPNSHSGVRHRAGKAFQSYFVSDGFLKGSGAQDHRYGAWRLVVRLNEFGEGEGEGGEILMLNARRAAAFNRSFDSTVDFDFEKYEYNVWTKTRLGLNVDVGLADKPMATGEKFQAQALLNVEGIPLRNAQPVLEIDQPTGSLSRFLASEPVSIERFQEVRKSLEAQGINDFWAAKAEALRLEGTFFNPARQTISAPLVEQQPGVYRLEVPLIPRVPGAYTLRVIARGDLRAGVPFRREVERNVSVEAQIDERTSVDVRFNVKQGTALIVVRPRDAFDNPILFDPKLSQPFTLRVQCGELEGELTPQLDGSYTQLVKLKHRGRATVELVVRERVVFSKTLPILSNLVWADVVEKHVPGNDRKANKHADPKTALGPLDDRGQFLALGALGSVTLGVRRSRLFMGSVTVFVQADREPRPYKVEALVRDASSKHRRGGCSSESEWVELGRSDGITETFTFGSSAGHLAPLVRITDLSGRSTSSPGQPLATPGVSIAAVGFEGRRCK